MTDTMNAAVVTSFEEPPHYRRVRRALTPVRTGSSSSTCSPSGCIRAYAVVHPAGTTPVRAGCH